MTVACSDLNPKSVKKSGTRHTIRGAKPLAAPPRAPRSRESNASASVSLWPSRKAASRRPVAPPGAGRATPPGVGLSLIVTGQSRFAAPPCAQADAALPSATRRRAELSPGAAQALSQLISETVTARDGKRQRKVPRPAADQIPIERRVDDPELQRADDLLVVRQNP